MGVVHTYHGPTRVVYGRGAVAEAGKLSSRLGQKALLVTDQGVCQAGLLDRVLPSLVGVGLPCRVFDQVRPDPDAATVEAIAAEGCSWGCDLVIGLGGGSPIDAAKAAAVIMAQGGSILEFIRGQRAIEGPLPPVLAIPTTSGTGSEVTRFAVILDRERSFKKGLGHEALYPKLALVDPDLKQTMPPRVAAATGMDALTHAVEAYTSQLAQPLSDGLALYAMELLAANLRAAVAGDQEAVEAVSVGSTIAGFAFSSSSTTLVHALSQAAGAHFGVAHGEVNAMLLPHVMRFNLAANLKRFARVAKALGAEVAGLDTQAAAGAGVEAVRRLIRDLGLPSRLSEVGVTSGGIDRMIPAALDTKLCISSNPRPVAAEDIRGLYRLAI